MSAKRRLSRPRADRVSPRTSLLASVFFANAAVVTIAVLVLALSPATVSRPTAAEEAAVLIVGVAALLVINLLLFRRAFGPLVRLRDAMRKADLLRPGQRVPVYGNDAEIADLTRAFNQMLERLERERRQSANRALRAQEGERHRVAQELHDEVGQSLTAVVLRLERVRSSVPRQYQGEIEELREAVRESLEEVRVIAQRLRPEALDELGLRNALAALADRVSEGNGLRVQRELDEQLPELDEEAELVIYRVAQESLTNVLRHAEAKQALLSLEGDVETVTLRVVDDGRGRTGAEVGAGIQGMRERALLVGATLTLQDLPGGGVEVRLELPLRQ